MLNKELAYRMICFIQVGVGAFQNALLLEQLFMKNGH